MVNIIDKTKTFTIDFKNIPVFNYFKYDGKLFMKIRPMHNPDESIIFTKNAVQMNPSGYVSKRFTCFEDYTLVEPVNVTIIVEAYSE